MTATSEMSRTGERLADSARAQINDTLEQAQGFASQAAGTLREQGSRVIEQAQSFYEELDGDSAAGKLRSVVTDYPFVSLAVAGVIGFLLSRAFDTRS